MSRKFHIDVVATSLSPTHVYLGDQDVVIDLTEDILNAYWKEAEPE